MQDERYECFPLESPNCPLQLFPPACNFANFTGLQHLLPNVVRLITLSVNCKRKGVHLRSLVYAYSSIFAIVVLVAIFVKAKSNLDDRWAKPT
ncbi:hypothetical protein QQP08_008349 [Theobroma cacao]|nr:hypothetical protein QQP08_008349 [Theobroma cacao]